MLAYKFRISFEDQDDFLREVELRSDLTFEDFHHAITSNLGLDPATLSSFFLCDHNYRKQVEIALVDMNPGEELNQNEEDEIAKVAPKVLVMKEALLCDHIDDPHQRLMYVYDYFNYWSFYIEMVKIVPADKSVSYPRITRSLGAVPRELTATPQPIPGEDKSLEFGFKEEAYDPDDIRNLDGEEDFMEDQENEPDNNFEEEQF